MTDARHRPGDTTAEVAEVERLRWLFRFFAATQCRGRSLVYETLANGVAENDGLLDLLLSTPGEQRRPSLLFAGVNLLLASDPGSELAAYYPIHGGRRAVDDRLVPAFAAFCGRHRGELVRILHERSTQTNEIRRCIALRLGLDHVHRHWPGPLALVEVGASAGLNLLFDQYRYRLNGRETATSATSTVVVSSEVQGGGAATPLLTAAPRITSRLGIDQKPVDPSDPGARAWLEAFVWPEQVDDLATLRGAIGLAGSGTAATVVRGEATTDTARLLAGLPGHEPVVVFTASLLSYLTADNRAGFVGQLREVAGRRPVAWVFAEGPGLLASAGLNVAALDGPLAQRNSHYLIGASLHGADRHNALLALADPYLRRIALARHATDDFSWVESDLR